MIDSTAGPNAFHGRLALSGWTAICRAGAYHAPHSHPDSAWSGVYYVDPGTDNPGQPLSGVLEFLDPRSGVEAVTAPGDPYGEPFRIRPEAGLLVIFPSWLYHWVHPYTGRTPRITVSFNATLAPVASLNAPADGLRPAEVAVDAGGNDLSAADHRSPVSPQLAQEETSHVDTPPIP
jgi:hypothetical protein